MGRLIDLSRARFGRLVVLYKVPSVKKRVLWMCVCDCGQRKAVRSDALVAGGTRSCGCLHREAAAIIGASAKWKHGLCRTTEYECWHGMRRRCAGKKPKDSANYYERGIYVCPEWNTLDGGFEAFLAHIGPKPSPELTVERINNDLGYQPGNVRWATRKEQNNNRRPAKTNRWKKMREAQAICH